jgi:hypothetical protein
MFGLPFLVWLLSYQLYSQDYYLNYGRKRLQFLLDRL